MELCTTMCSSASGHNSTPVSGSFHGPEAAAVVAARWRRRLRRCRRDIGAAGLLPELPSVETLVRPAANDEPRIVRWRSIQMAAAAASKRPSCWVGATGASWRTMIGGSRLTAGDAVADSSGSATVVVVVRVNAVVVVVDVLLAASATRWLFCLLALSSLPPDTSSRRFE